MSVGDNCSAGCRSRSHNSYGECLRDKALQVANPEAREWNQHVNETQGAYVDARKAGLQPEGSSARQIGEAWAITEATGKPFRADAPIVGLEA